MTLVVTLEEASDPLAGGCVPVPHVGWDICEMCHREVNGWSRCWSCNQTVRTLTHACDLVVPISLMAKDTQLYTTLKRYKGGSTDQRLAAIRTVGLLGRFLRDHGACITAHGGGWDTITHVPSTSGLHPGTHPLVRALSMHEPLFGQHADLLDRGPGSIGRSAGSDDAFVARAEARGRSVLVIDDTWTTGAHAQSAASALELALIFQ